MAERFAGALRAGDPEAIQAILPAGGKILVSIPETGRDAGYFGRSQVTALFGSYLASYVFTECRIDHVQVQDSIYARIDLTADRSGPGNRGAVVPVSYRLAFQVEQGRWVLREIRETTR